MDIMDPLIFLPWILVFILGLILSLCDMYFKLSTQSQDMIFTKWGGLYYALNGIIAIVLLITLLYFNVTTMDTLRLSVIVGFGYPMLMRSQLSSIAIKGTDVPIGFNLIQQFMEKFFIRKMEDVTLATSLSLTNSLKETHTLDELHHYAINIIDKKLKKKQEKKKELEIFIDQQKTDTGLLESERMQSLSQVIVDEGGIFLAKKLIKEKQKKDRNKKKPK